ncbi:MAG: SDR family oxidoreductase [Victivallales bacterium]|nr:SDR family oxidoreductase [Victivallales bacterium]
MKNILVTGATRGVGLALIQALTPKRWRIHALGRDFSSIPNDPARDIVKVEYNLEDVNGIPALVASLPPMDALVNNAGMMLSIPYDDYSRSDAARLMAVNLEAPVWLIREVSRNMIEKKAGRIINNASIAAYNGLYFDIWYGITKAGLINATKTYARILGAHSIAVNSIAPGPIETDMADAIPVERIQGFKTSVPSGRLAKPEEVAEVIRWLVEDAPTYITGACVDVNNSALMR